ncbi:hypothetical protein [Nocardiopsis lucentensis]|uniref:hypothetical protein n=1 Tax=Nocardiopsis lucentensis TaxID=53441 RepID=UPI00034B9E9B|nr:hypothetical protein [Nocardiopsis lucentensis]
MDGRTPTRRQRTLAVPLVALVVMCFLCALCHSAVPEPSSLVAADCPDLVQETVEARPGASSPTVPHPCEAAEAHGVTTAAPLFLLALGVVLTFTLLLAPRPGPACRATRHRPSPPHGHGLLTLLCVQRV